MSDAVTCQARGCEDEAILCGFCSVDLGRIPDRILVMILDDAGSKSDALLVANGLCALSRKMMLTVEESRALAVLL